MEGWALAAEALGDMCETVLQSLEENKLMLLEANKVEGNHDTTDPMSGQSCICTMDLCAHPFENCFLCLYFFFPPSKIFSVLPLFLT